MRKLLQCKSAEKSRIQQGGYDDRDSERTARAVAAKVGVDEYYSEVLPEDKASFRKREAKGRKVVMLGDGINDSPALLQLTQVLR